MFSKRRFKVLATSSMGRSRLRTAQPCHQQKCFGSPHVCVQNVCQVSRDRNGCGGVPKFVFPMPVTNIEKTSFTESQRTLPKLQLLCVSTLVSSGARSRSFVVWQSTHK